MLFVNQLLTKEPIILQSEEQVTDFIINNNITNFTADEFKCKHCGEIKIDGRLLLILQEIRNRYGKPMIITSGYRCPTYNAAIGGVPGSAHTYGYAADILVKTSQDRYELLRSIIEVDVPRIGIASNFIHIDIDPEKLRKTGKVIWLYGNKRHIA